MLDSLLIEVKNKLNKNELSVFEKLEKARQLAIKESQLFDSSQLIGCANHSKNAYHGKKAVKSRRINHGKPPVQLNLFKTAISLIKSAYSEFKANHSYGQEWAENRINLIGVQLVNTIKSFGFKCNYKLRSLLENHNVFSFYPEKYILVGSK